MPHAACIPIPNLSTIARGGGIMIGNRRGGSHAILKGCYITNNYATREGGVALVVIDLRGQFISLNLAFIFRKTLLESTNVNGFALHPYAHLKQLRLNFLRSDVSRWDIGCTRFNHYDGKINYFQ